MTSSSSTSSPSSPASVQFYFQCAVVVIGVVGTATNALILYALAHKKHVLIVNQNAIDVFSSFFLTVTYSLKLCNIYLKGTTGYWLCTLLLSESLSYSGMVGSSINLAAISVERYLKIVHRTWSKNHLRKWMIYSAAAFSWIGSLTYMLGMVFPTTKVINGVCYPYAFWQNEMAAAAQTIWGFVSFYVIILLIFIFCYWRILAVIRHQASVMAGHSASSGSSTNQTHYNHIEASIIKTMVLVSVLYAITWLLNYVCIFLIHLSPDHPFLIRGYYVAIIISFMYICTNPFIYATKLEPVKEILLRMIPCKKVSEQGASQCATAGTGTIT